MIVRVHASLSAFFKMQMRRVPMWYVAAEGALPNARARHVNRHDLMLIVIMVIDALVQKIDDPLCFCAVFPTVFDGRRVGHFIP